MTKIFNKYQYFKNQTGTVDPRIGQFFGRFDPDSIVVWLKKVEPVEPCLFQPVSIVCIFFTFLKPIEPDVLPIDLQSGF
jgi:hypothetical protein